MRHLFVLFFLLTFGGVAAQKPYYGTLKWPEQDTASKFYTVKGERQGVSFFKKHYFQNVQYVSNSRTTN